MTKKIVAVGGANVDWSCRVLQPVVIGTSNPGTITRSFGGVARNVACNLARLGVPVTLISAVGEDALGAELLADAVSADIDCSPVLRLAAPTSTYVATLDADGELVVAVAAMDITEALTPERISAHETALAGAELIFADANLPAESLVRLGEIAARHGVPLALDPVSTRKAVRLRPLLGAKLPIFLLAPNRDELGVLADRPGDIEKAADILSAAGVKNLIVGLGAAGAYVLGSGECGYVASRAQHVEDVTGAGDSAMAAMLWAWRAGYGLLRAAHAGQIAAAMTVASLSAVCPSLTADALEAALAEMETVLR